MLFSILVPVRNDPGNLASCLQSLAAQDLSDCEILVADDGSQPAIEREDLLGQGRLRLFRLPGRGPAAARNFLALQATGDYLFFLDADTQASPTLLECARRVITEHPGIRSFFGSYDDAPAWPSLVSVYRNLLHHHTHQQSGGCEVSTFWCGCGVIERRLYLDCGRLSEAYRTPSIEDIAFGAYLRERGILTRIVPDLQVKHLKRWTFRSWLYHRPVPPWYSVGEADALAPGMDRPAEFFHVTARGGVGGGDPGSVADERGLVAPDHPARPAAPGGLRLSESRLLQPGFQKAWRPSRDRNDRAAHAVHARLCHLSRHGVPVSNAQTGVRAPPWLEAFCDQFTLTRRVTDARERKALTAQASIPRSPRRAARAAPPPFSAISSVSESLRHTPARFARAEEADQRRTRY